MKLRTKRAIVEIEVHGVKVTAEQVTPKEANEIHSECTTWKGKGGATRPTTDTDEAAFQIFSRMVKDWEGAEDADGSPLPCTPANKRLVYTYDNEFAAEVMQRVRERLNAKEDLEGKNS
jgi:hypothetical protein